MQLDEVQRAKLTIKLDELKKKKWRLSNKLTELRSFHMAAAAEYGSELCAGGMEADERRLADTITDVSQMIAAVSLCLDRGLDPGEKYRKQEEIRGIDTSIAELQDRKKMLLRQTELLQILESFMA